MIAALDRLGPARGLAQRLAVLGPSFDAREIGYVAADTDVVDAGIETMVAADVLRRDGGRLRFASALVAETAYDSLLKADRMALHEIVADAMTTDGAPAERLAFHLEAAGRPFDAAVAWRRAAAEAIRRARHREAIHHARRAIEILDRLDPAPDGGETRRAGAHRARRRHAGVPLRDGRAVGGGRRCRDGPVSASTTSPAGSCST